MRKITSQAVLRVIILGVLVAVSKSGFSHHSYAIYDILNPVSIEGEVIRYRYAQPHPVLHLRETKESGETVDWVFEGISIRMWSRRGVTTDIAESGEKMTVTGWPERSGKPKMLLSTVVRESGEEIVILDEVQQTEARAAAGLDVEGARGTGARTYEELGEGAEDYLRLEE